MAIDRVFGQSSSHVLVAGHRGIRARYPENTMLSFRKAIELGVDMIEMDVNLSADGIPVVIHDRRLERTTNGTGFVGSKTLRELQQLDAGVRFNGVFPACRIPTLEEFLALAAQHPSLTLNVEIKEMTTECVDKTIDQLRSFGLLDRIVIASFDAAVLRYAHRRHGIRTQGFPEHYMANFDAHTYECMYAAGIEMSDLTPELCREMLDRGVDPWGYCPDTDEGVYQAIRSGTALITCNDPEPALRILREQGLHE
ncbi:MAG: glycerophosphodiester phosphodiesterase [Acutalibacteraceae bacterium]